MHSYIFDSFKITDNVILSIKLSNKFNDMFKKYHHRSLLHIGLGLMFNSRTTNVRIDFLNFVSIVIKIHELIFMKITKPTDSDCRQLIENDTSIFKEKMRDS